MVSDKHEHKYLSGWVPDEDASGWEVSNDMAAWRFCPVCSAALSDSGFLGDDPQCSTCRRPYMWCPCGCVEDGVNVSQSMVEAR